MRLGFGVSNMKIPFTKMQACGNDYVYVNTILHPVDNPNELSQKISDRHYGVGSDGLVLIGDSELCDFRMRIFNPDGTEAEMCGNALRSVAKYVYTYGLTSKKNFTIETLGGNQKLELTVRDGEVIDIRAEIGRPIFTPSEIPVLTEEKEYFLEQPIQVGGTTFLASSLSWGNPHTVIFVEDVDTADVKIYGPLIETLPCFPRRTNVSFVQVVDAHHIRIRVWERGAGETLGCGTGCCAAAAIAFHLGKCASVIEVSQPGGILKVEIHKDWIVSMQGPSQIVFQGEYEYEA